MFYIFSANVENKLSFKEFTDYLDEYFKYQKFIGMISMLSAILHHCNLDILSYTSLLTHNNYINTYDDINKVVDTTISNIKDLPDKDKEFLTKIFHKILDINKAITIMILYLYMPSYGNGDYYLYLLLFDKLDIFISEFDINNFEPNIKRLSSYFMLITKNISTKLNELSIKSAKDNIYKQINIPEFKFTPSAKAIEKLPKIIQIAEFILFFTCHISMIKQNGIQINLNNKDIHQQLFKNAYEILDVIKSTMPSEHVNKLKSYIDIVSKIDNLDIPSPEEINKEKLEKLYQAYEIQCSNKNLENIFKDKKLDNIYYEIIMESAKRVQADSSKSSN